MSQIFEKLWRFKHELEAKIYLEKLCGSLCAISLILMFCLYCLKKKKYAQNQIVFTSAYSFESVQTCPMFFYEEDPKNKINYFLVKGEIRLEKCGALV